ncbi:MAG: hypothetical protein LBU95_03525 [Rikenellaceae bacterium]|jgi:hypothetical protein|nr:hypothetical protein [Rikenellaceae bacterium]
MVKLLIDGREARCDAAMPFTITIDAPASWDVQGRELKVSLPIDRRNAAVLGDVAQALSRDKFNAQAHTGVIQADGCAILRGEVYLQSIERGPHGGGWYHMVVREPRPGWVAQAAERMFKTIPIDFSCEQGIESIIASWTWDKPVRFLPVQRDQLLVRNASQSVIQPAVVLSAENYHPFLHVRSLVRAIIAGAGYSLVSRFMDGALFDSLHMSGFYPEQDTYVLKSRLDFRAGRFADATAVIDRNGRVKTSPYTTQNTVGNIVETADPAATKNGVTAQGVFNTGGALRMEGERVAFVPQAEVQVGFEYYINYRTSYKIRSRTELAGINSVMLPDGITHSFKLVNRFTDMREVFTTGMNYRVVVFDYVAGTSYMVRYDEITNPAADMDNLHPLDYQTIIVLPFSALTQSLNVTGTMPVRNMVLWARAANESKYTVYTGDWALYEGWVTETGTTEVEVTLRSAPEKFTPTAPAYFDTVLFMGGTEGGTFTLLKSTHIRPIFSANPAMGSVVRFADVAAHAVRQSALIEALAHMFNLRFYTDEHAREVHIEPFAEFFGDEVVDWSALTDPARGVVIAEPGAGMSRTTTLRYRTGDDAVAAWNDAHFDELGQMSFTIADRLAAERARTLENPLFTPTLSVKGGYPDAPGAWMLQVGERSAYPVERNDSMNFPAKIVHYMGKVTLPAGQVWGWPVYLGWYPMAAFHCPGTDNGYSGSTPNPLSSFSDDTATLVRNGFSLCFEDRDGVAGLHPLHDPLYEGVDRGRRITLWLRLGAADIEALQNPSALGRDLRRTFLIGVGAEKIACRLETVHDYDPFSVDSVKCTFLTI